MESPNLESAAGGSWVWVAERAGSLPRAAMQSPTAGHRPPGPSLRIV